MLISRFALTYCSSILHFIKFIIFVWKVPHLKEELKYCPKSLDTFCFVFQSRFRRKSDERTRFLAAVSVGQLNSIHGREGGREEWTHRNLNSLARLLTRRTGPSTT